MEKLDKKIFSLLERHKISIKTKILVKSSKTASEQPLFAVPELNPTLYMRPLLKEVHYSLPPCIPSSTNIEDCYFTVPLSCGWLEKKVPTMLTKYDFFCIAQGSK